MRWLGMICLAVGPLGCTQNKSHDAVAESPIERGRKVYQASCTACHNADPAKDGALGPAIVGASLELLERRVVHGDYPSNYVPKRKTRLMVALPQLKDDVKALHSFLNTSP